MYYTGMTSELYSITSLDTGEPMTEDSTGEEDSVYDDILNTTTHDSITAQLVSAGPAGVAAAAAIASGKKRRRLHSFETNPSIRKRQQTRLLRKLCALMEEYIVRVGQQAVIVCCTPGKPQQQTHAFRVFGSQPLEGIVRSHKSSIMNDLETSLAQQAPPNPESSMLYDLPPLAVDGIPTALDKMTQAQLRFFIPEMLKFSTGKSKPGWGKAECRPVWWPEDVPWANVRSDVRDDDTKRMVNWTNALRKIVLNCYRHHGREDLLPDFSSSSSNYGNQTQSILVQHINNPDGTMRLVHLDTGTDNNQRQILTLSDGTQAHIIPASLSGIIKTENFSDGVPISCSQTLTQLLTEDGQLLQLNEGNSNTVVHLPAAVYQSMMNSLSQYQNGQSLVSADSFQELTTDCLDKQTGQMVALPINVLPQNSDESLECDENQSNGLIDVSEYTITMIRHQSS